MQFRHNEQNPLEAQAIVVDEASMLDLFLAHSFVKAIPPDAQVLIVGDVDQLPSVGPGMVLADLIASEQIPVVRLTEVFRQAAESHIVTNAHRINVGQFPRLVPTTKFGVGLPVAGCARAELGAKGFATSSVSFCPDTALTRYIRCRYSADTRGRPAPARAMLLQQVLTRSSRKDELARGGTIPAGRRPGNPARQRLPARGLQWRYRYNHHH